MKKPRPSSAATSNASFSSRSPVRLGEARPRQRRQRCARRLAGPLDRRVAKLILRQQNFGGPQAHELAFEIGGAGFAQQKLARRNVERGQMIARRGLAGLRHRGQKIVGAGDQQRILGERAGRHQPHHVAPHHRLRPPPLRRLRVFELLGDGHAEALADELLQIFVRARHRHAAHRDVLARVLPAFRQRNAERARGLHRVVEEQLEEIAHAVEEQEIRVLGLHLKILRHHRRGVRRPRRLRPRAPSALVTAMTKLGSLARDSVQRAKLKGRRAAGGRLGRNLSPACVAAMGLEKYDDLV